MERAYNDLGFFAGAVLDSAEVREVRVCGELDYEGSASGSDSYRFRASFGSNVDVRSINLGIGDKVMFNGDVFLDVHADSEGERKKGSAEFVIGSLGEIKRKMDVDLRSGLSSRVDEDVLIVGSNGR